MTTPYICMNKDNIFFIKALGIISMILFLFSSFAAARRIPDSALGKAEYEVRYKYKLFNSKVATAVISLSKDKWEGRSAFHAKASIKASSVFRMFMGEEYVSDSYLTSSATPLYCINPLKKDKVTGKREYYYNSKSKTIESVLAWGDETPKSKVISQDGPTMELLSLIFFTRFYDFSSGEKIKLHVLMNGRSYPATLCSEGIDNERFPGRKVERVLLEMTERGLMEDGSGNEITMWRSTGSDRTAFCLEVPLSSGLMTVMIK